MITHTLVSFLTFGMMCNAMLEQHVRVTPWFMEDVIVRAARVDDSDTIAFTVRRDLSKVRWRDGRAATLLVCTATEVVEKRTLDGETGEGWLVYAFTLPIDQMACSWFRLSEHQSGDGAERVIGGGVTYEIRLGDFAVQIDEADRADEPVAEPGAGETTLAEAVHTFNTSAARPAGPDETPLAPLTVDEVRAAIRWWRFQRADAAVSDHDFERLLRIAETDVMPAGALISSITRFQPNDELEFTGWSVRLTMPLTDTPGMTYDFTIRERWLSSRRIGPLERAMRER